MSLNYKRQIFGPYCPSGGDWYSCGYGSRFVGCCRSQPCVNDCPDGNLEPASFDPRYYGQFPDQQCSSGSRWYTCTGTKPPFMGCCKSNPCQQDGCPTGDLTAGFLSSNPADAAAFSPSGGSSSAAASSTTTSSPSSSTISSVATSTSASSASNSASDTSAMPTQSPTATTATSKSAPVGAIAGGVAGGVAVLAIIIGLLIYYYRHAANSRKARNDEVNRRLSFPTTAAIAGDPKAALPPDSSLPAYPTSTPGYTAYNPSAPYHPTGYNLDDPTMKPAFELPAGYERYPRNPDGEPIFPTQSIARKSLPHRLSELSGESARARAELESPHSSPIPQSQHSPPQSSYSPPQSPHSPHSPQSTRSSGANWTRLPWVGLTDTAAGLRIEEEERLESRGRRATYEGT